MPVKPTTKTKTAKKTKNAKPAKEAEILETFKTPETAKISIAEKKKDSEIAADKLERGSEESEKGPLGVEKYYESVGRRKEAVARVRIYTKKSSDTQVLEDKALITVNGRPYYEYFKNSRLQNIVDAPLRKLKSLNRFKATVKISGGGIRGQADAIRLGLSRSLVLFDVNFSKKLRKAGYLTRDARVKERRKYGLKKARKAPQWAKR